MRTMGCISGANLLHKNVSIMAAQGSADEPKGVEIAFKWTKAQTEEFIKLRGQNDHLFTGAKNSACTGWRTILEQMGLEHTFSPRQAKKKWDNLKKRYKECKDPGTGEGVSGKHTIATWHLFPLMDEVLGHKPSIAPPGLIAYITEETLGPNAFGAPLSEEEAEEQQESQPGPLRGKRKRSTDRKDKLVELIKEDMRMQREADERRARESKERMEMLFSLLERAVTEEQNGAEFTFKWTKEQNEEFIKLRGQNVHLFTGAKNSATTGWRVILEQMGLERKVSPRQAKKKWDNLKKRYKECKDPGTGEGGSGKHTAATWHLFPLMDEVLGHKPSIPDGPSVTPPALIAYITEERLGQSVFGAPLSEEEAEEQEEIPPGQMWGKRRRREERKDELMDLIKEDMRMQREAEERRAQDNRERMEMLFSLLERVVERR